MERFSKRHFLEADEDQRKELCEELSDMLSLRLRSAPSFHAGVLDCIGQLRSEGHDLWSFDEGDDFELWCPDYSQPSGPGLVLTFDMPAKVTVQWSSAEAGV